MCLDFVNESHKKTKEKKKKESLSLSSLVYSDCDWKYTFLKKKLFSKHHSSKSAFPGDYFQQRMNPQQVLWWVFVANKLLPVCFWAASLLPRVSKRSKRSISVERDAGSARRTPGCSHLCKNGRKKKGRGVRGCQIETVNLDAQSTSAVPRFHIGVTIFHSFQYSCCSKYTLRGCVQCCHFKSCTESAWSCVSSAVKKPFGGGVCRFAADLTFCRCFALKWK